MKICDFILYQNVLYKVIKYLQVQNVKLGNQLDCIDVFK